MNVARVRSTRLSRSARALTLAFGLVTAGLVGIVSAQTPTPATPTPAVAQPAVPSATDMPTPPAPTTPGKAYILMDHASGQVLAGDNIDARLEPASITKVMTSYVVAAEMQGGKIKRDEPVRISERAWREGGAGTDGSFSALELNSEVAFDDVLRGLIIQSGNDAAIALAEHVAGSEEAFVALMNQYAQRLGMTNSHFVNAHGLSAPEHYMSVHDVALLSRALIRDFPAEYAMYSEKKFTYNGIPQYNRNNLLGRDASVDGIKTGHTSAAGYCLAASAKRGDQRLISVVMGIDASSNREGFRAREDANLALLNWGFRFFETQPLYQADVKIAEQKVWKGAADSIALGVAAPLLVTVPRGKYAQLKPAIDVPTQLLAPVSKGQKIGTLRVTLDGKTVAQRPLIALADVAEGGFFKRTLDEFWIWWEAE